MYIICSISSVLPYHMNTPFTLEAIMEESTAQRFAALPIGVQEMLLLMIERNLSDCSISQYDVMPEKIPSESFLYTAASLVTVRTPVKLVFGFWEVEAVHIHCLHDGLWYIEANARALTFDEGEPSYESTGVTILYALEPRPRVLMRIADGLFLSPLPPNALTPG